MLKAKSLPVMLAGLVIVAALLVGMAVQPQKSAAEELASFSSYNELVQYIEKNSELAGRFGLVYGSSGMTMGKKLAMPGASPQDRLMESNAAMSERAPSKATPDYSGTNNQVWGVDEADLVKTDGAYLYVISNNKLVIIRAYPAAEAKKVSEITFSGHPQEAFINKDKLVVFGAGPDPGQMFVQIYNVTDRKKPVLQKDVTCDGNYVTARMIGDYVYTVVNAPVTRYVPGKDTEKITLPRLLINGKERTVQPSEIYHFNYPDYSYRYTILLSFNTGEERGAMQSKTLLTGVSQHVYASTGNLYLAGIKTPDFALYTQKLLEGLASLVPGNIAAEIKAVLNSNSSYSTKLQQVEEIMDAYLSGLDYEKALALEEKIAEYRDKWYRDIARDQNKTVIYKLAIAGGRVEYRCRGEVGGQLLNQFSMDEHEGYFRIATTSEGFLFTGVAASRNNIYILDENLQVTGKLLGLAPTERIYSARFMGDRAYLVTFRRIDPLFVIDLKDPAKPGVLGELKIPGYSDYLHPYDENHLIGIGREIAVAPAPGPLPGPEIMPLPTRERGVKIALFDVSNPAAPREIAKYVIDRDDSDSPALRDHRAVLFSKERNLLVLPVTYGAPFRIMVIDPPSGITPDHQGWQGAFVFNISPDQGIRLKGKVEHPAGHAVNRSLYINEVLYTVSGSLVKLNNLENLGELKQIKLQ